MENENQTVQNEYDALKLENQLCFPLYACSKEIVRLYKPFLDKLDLTYTQYITMMVFWEYGEMNVKELGKKLFLDSGTLTPVLKKLEAKEFITRSRSKKDERNLIVSITKKGRELRELAKEVPSKMACKFILAQKDAAELYKILHKLMNNFSQNEAE